MYGEVECESSVWSEGVIDWYRWETKEGERRRLEVMLSDGVKADSTEWETVRSNYSAVVHK